MRSSIARRAAVFGSAALLLLGPITAVANAEPNESGVSDQAAHLPVELAEALQHDLALTPDQFVSRSELAQKLAEFAAIARVQFPDSFAGVWLDDLGKGIVALADGRDKDAAREAAEKAGFEVKDVAQSEQALQGQLSALNTWLDSQPAEVADLVRGIAVDVVGNGVALTADPAAGIELPEFLKRTVVHTAAPLLVPPIVADSSPQPDPQPATLHWAETPSAQPLVTLDCVVHSASTAPTVQDAQSTSAPVTAIPTVPLPAPRTPARSSRW